MDAVAIAPMAALRSLWWLVRGKRQRSANILIDAVANHPNHYRRFISAQNATLARRLDKPHSAQEGGLIAVIVARPGSTAADEAATESSLQLAFGADFVIHRCADGGRSTFAGRSGEPLGPTIASLAAAHPSCWAIIVLAGDLIDRNAGPLVRCTIANAENASLVYWDEDLLRGGIYSAPWLKPQWDELIHFARDCLTGASALRLDTPIPTAMSGGDARELKSWAALLSNLAAATDVAPVHLSAVLTHRASQQPPFALEECASHLREAWGEVVGLSEMPGHAGWRLVEFQSPDEWPGVSIIIPSKDQASLLRTCLGSLDQLAYKGPVEVIIVDNGSSQPEALDLLASLEAKAKAKVLRSPGPFNFSALINLAAQNATHPFLCLLNNDVEATSGDWLAKMIVQAVRPGVGAVGAQLLYPDGTVQHAGVVIGIGGVAGHFAKGVNPDASLHRGWFGITRHVSAVTAACLVVRKTLFFSVGGFDDRDLSVAFNDVDFCLKLGRARLRNVYVAEARLIHLESKSRGYDLKPEKAKRLACEEAVLKSRWGTDKFMDPWFNPQFSRRLETIALSLKIGAGRD